MLQGTKGFKSLLIEYNANDTLAITSFIPRSSVLREILSHARWCDVMIGSGA